MDHLPTPGPVSSDSDSRTDCPRCNPCGPEFYWYLGLYEFDVERARTMVADGREAVEVEEDSVRASVHDSVIHDAHIDHVDPSFPGIIAHVFYRTEEGESVQAHVLIDGNHRAARCLREGRPYHAYLLTEEESRAILLLGGESSSEPDA